MILLKIYANFMLFAEQNSEYYPPNDTKTENMASQIRPIFLNMCYCAHFLIHSCGSR